MPAEEGIPGAVLRLFDDAGTLIAKTRTNSLGQYLFKNVEEGHYRVEIDEKTVPEGFELTTVTDICGFFLALSFASLLLAQLIEVTDDPLINDGGIFALVGPTGVGKTELARALAADVAGLAQSTPAFIEALGGAGETGWDWVIAAFELAREHFPSSELLLNDYNVLVLEQFTSDYLQVVELLWLDIDDKLVGRFGRQAF